MLRAWDDVEGAAEDVGIIVDVGGISEVAAPGSVVKCMVDGHVVVVVFLRPSETAERHTE